MHSVALNTIRRRPGRPKFSGNKDVIQPEVLAGCCKATIDDGRLLMSVSRVAYALDVAESTVSRLIIQAAIPAVFLPEKYGAEKFRLVPRVPAEALLSWLRAQYPERI